MEMKSDFMILMPIMLTNFGTLIRTKSYVLWSIITASVRTVSIYFYIFRITLTSYSNLKHSKGPTPVKIRVTPCTTPSRESWTMSNSRLRNLLDPIRCIMISEVNFNAAHLSGAFVVDGECYDRIETHRLWEAVF